MYIDVHLLTPLHNADTSVLHCMKQFPYRLYIVGFYKPLHQLLSLRSSRTLCVKAYPHLLQADSKRRPRNVVVKIGGFGMRFVGFGFEDQSPDCKELRRLHKM